MNQLTLEWSEAGRSYSRVLGDQQPSKHPGAIRIGRDPAQCDVVISDPTVSGLHVEIRFDPTAQTVSLQNLRQSNPPLVDNRQVVQGTVVIRDGSIIYLGQVPLRVSAIRFGDSIGSTQVAFKEDDLDAWEPPSVVPSPGSYPPQSTQKPIPLVEDSQVSFSQLMPILSTGKDLSSKAFLGPAIFIVLVVVGLFAAVGSPTMFNFLLALSIGIAALYFIYRLCDKPKPWWILLASAVTTMVMLVTPIFDLFALVFRVILPGQIPEDGAGLISIFIGFFFGAGLLEELLKAVPVFGAMWLGQREKSPLRRERIGVWEPLDGILLASASALGFTLLETLGQYVPGIIDEVSSQFDAGTGELLGLQLLIPRVLGSVAGHMAYSGYFGYFIGLSVLKPRSRVQILLIGYLTSALLHALWNTSGSFSPLLLALVGIASYAFLAAAILKAKELSQRRRPSI